MWLSKPRSLRVLLSHRQRRAQSHVEVSICPQLEGQRCFSKLMVALSSRLNSNPQSRPVMLALNHVHMSSQGNNCLHSETVCRAIMLLCETSLPHQLSLMGFKSQRSIWFILFCSNRQPSTGAPGQLEQSSVGCRSHSLEYSSHMWKSPLILCPDPHSGRAAQLPLLLGTNTRQKP